jgi:hypothetical protein
MGTDGLNGVLQGVIMDHGMTIERIMETASEDLCCLRAPSDGGSKNRREGKGE